MAKNDMLLVVAVAAFLVLSGVVDLGTTASDVRVTKTGAYCGDDAEATIQVRSFKSVVPSTGVKTGIAITTSATDGAKLMQGTNTIESITTSATAYSAFTKKIPCGEDFHIIIGKAGSSGYYYAKSGLVTADKTTVNVDFDDAAALHEVGTITISAKETTTGDYTAAGTVLNTDEALAGGWVQELNVLVKENSGKVVRGPALCFDYNVSAISSVEIIGGAKLAAVPVQINANEECWSVGGEDLILKNYASVVANVKVEAKTASLTNNSITIDAVDFGNYLHNGEIVDGYEDASDSDIHAANPTDMVYYPVGST